MRRRRFLTGVAGAAGVWAAGKRPTIMLRSGWQTINIGDIAHTPGVLALIEKHIPEADAILWAPAVDGGTEPMLRRRFPKLRIVQGALSAESIAAADMLMHGSAASVSSPATIEGWRQAAKKPYGFFGVGFTLQGEAAGVALSPELRSLLDGSAFVFTRETNSLANLKRAGIRAAEMGFAPDGTFSMDITDEARAQRYLRESGLEQGRFACFIPRLRYTPYHKIRKVTWSAEEIERRTAVNEKHAETDHAKLREAITAFVRKTGGKALLCPEMTYQIPILDELLYDGLPADVKPKVVRKKTFWLPDEASSVYKRAVVVVSSECHSPILSAVQGTPCMYVHQPEDGIKGQMWNDIGLGDWYFQVEEATGEQIAKRVLEIAGRPEQARKKVRAAVEYAQGVQRERMRFVRNRVLRLE